MQSEHTPLELAQHYSKLIFQNQKTFQTQFKENFLNYAKDEKVLLFEKISQLFENITLYLQSSEQKTLTFSEQNTYIVYNFKNYMYYKISSQEKINIPNDQIIIKNPLNMNVNSQDFKHFTRLTHLILQIITNLKTENYCTKREIYYQDPDLFQNQETTDELIKDLAFNFQVPRKMLHIVSASKGLVAGNIQFFEGEIEYDLKKMSYLNQSKQISEFTKQITNIQTQASFILLVEKETVYFQLLMENSPDLLQNSIIITGKGYPDYATRSFLEKLVENFPYLPIFYLGDYDPYGFDILTCYCFSSANNTFECNSLPQIFYLGILSNDFESLSPNNDQQLDHHQINKIDLSPNDIKQIQEISQRDYIIGIQRRILLNLERDIDRFQIIRWDKWINQLEKMDFKLEIENIYPFIDSLSSFILEQINQGYFL